MDNNPPTPLGKLGWTVGSATCMDGAADGKRLFQVIPGNCADHAMEQASILLASARRASYIGVMDNEPTLVWAAHYLGEMAKALMDDAHMGMHKNGETLVAQAPVVSVNAQFGACALPRFCVPA